jgi:hypothetical protein
MTPALKPVIESARSSHKLAALRGWLGPAVLAVAFVSLSVWSWRKWPDVQVDFGCQLYIPWQLSLGKVLYVDIAYAYGPISQYFNALLFTIFGVSLTTLMWANLAVLATLCGLIYRIFDRAFGWPTATLVCLAQLGIFSFSQYTGYSNYNYICPYTYEQTHGVALAVAMIFFLGEWVRRNRLRWCGLAGACLGLVFLTKAELFVPAVGAACLGFSLASLGMSGRRLGIALATVVGTALLPVAGCFLFLMRQMAAAAALRGVASNWLYLQKGVSDQFYLMGMGFDDPNQNLLLILEAFASIVAVLGVACGADVLFNRIRNHRHVWCAAAGVGVFAALAWASDWMPWDRVGRALPLTTLILFLGFGGACVQRRDSRQALARLLPVAMWALFALLLLGKMLLKVRLSHFGFVLAMPATLLLVACLTGVIPSWLRARRGGGNLAAATLAAFILAGVLFHLRWSNALYAWKDLRIEAGGDSIVAENPGFNPRGNMIATAERRLRALMPPGATLLALPEGAMLNYWLRRPNPTMHLWFLPGSFRFFGGEAVFLQTIEAHPPDFIALIHRDTEEFGYGYFGVDPRYGRQIMDWVGRHYVRIERIGAEPFRDGRFGIVILRRRSGDAVSHGARAGG